MPHSRQNWLDHPHSLPRSLRHWLCDKGSLTQRLQARCAQFQVVPLLTARARPNLDECSVLNLTPGVHAYVREVLLLCNDIPVVFAHSVLPCTSLRGAWNGISQLGSRPLGQALFSDHRIQRQALAYKNLHRDHPLFVSIARQHTLNERTLWARRSVFCLEARPLLVTEVFLPTITSL